MTFGRGTRCKIATLAILLLWPALSGSPARAQDRHLLNFRDAEIRAFIEDVSMFTGRTFILDPLVQGKVTVVSEVPLVAGMIFEVFLSTLRVHGFAAMPTASGAWKIVKEENAAEQAQPLAAAEATGDRFVTGVFALDHIDGPTAMRAVQPMVNARGRAIAQPGENFLILVDYASNMARLREVIDRIDVDRTVMRTLSLRHMSAGEMTKIARELSGASGGAEERRRGGLSVVPVEAGNAIVLRGAPALVEALLPTLAEIDNEAASRGSIRVMYLKHADAAEVAPLLKSISATIGGGEGAPSRASIAVNEATNALVISAEPDMLLALEQVIERLDIRRAQVLVEAIIVEVSDNAARDLGLQYMLGGKGSNIPFTATNFSQTAPNILAAAGALAVDEETDGSSDLLAGLQQAAINSLIGISGFAGGFAGLTDGGTLFGVILTALQQDISSNILSTPHIMTMDNQAASIIVGQDVPITTGEVVGSDFVNPFRTVERRDIGVQLEVTPQINDGGVVTLAIRQEVSSILGPASAQSQELIFNKREIATTVSVDDGEIIVLGGLIENDERVSLQKVPFLGDIPVLGHLFRSESRSRTKTNLMVFLRPTIVRDSGSARAVTGRKLDTIRAEQLVRNEGTVPGVDRFMREIFGSEIDLPGTPGTPVPQP